MVYNLYLKFRLYDYRNSNFIGDPLAQIHLREPEHRFNLSLNPRSQCSGGLQWRELLIMVLTKSNFYNIFVDQPFNAKNQP